MRSLHILAKVNVIRWSEENISASSIIQHQAKENEERIEKKMKIHDYLYKNFIYAS